MQKESSQNEIIASQIIVGILTLYVSYWIFINIEANLPVAILNFEKKYYFEGTIFMLIFLASLIFQIIVLTQMLKNKTSKYKFSNFQRNFHPFFKDENQDNLLYDYIFASIISFIFFYIFPYIYYYFSKDTDGYFSKDTDGLGAFFAILSHLGILIAAITRNETLDKLPVKLMETNKICLILPYEDYINKQISDDEPHLSLNQSFEFKVKELPRDETEKNTIEIRNNNTPNNSALISRIEDCGLANVIRNGDIIKSRLVSVGEFAKLEIELSIDKVP
jgi:hypothetical protein